MHFGEFTRSVMSWEGHHLKKDWEVREDRDQEEEIPEELPDPHWMDKHLPGGLYWIGMPWANKVYDYHFQYTNIRQGSTGPTTQTPHGVMSTVEQGKLQDLLFLISRDERPDFIFLKRDVYGITFQDTDDQDMIPLSFIALLTARVVNPYRALFMTEQWLEQVTNFLRRYVKEYVGRYSFIELVTDARKHDTEHESVGRYSFIELVTDVRKHDTEHESKEILDYPAPTDKNGTKVSVAEVYSERMGRGDLSC